VVIGLLIGAAVAATLVDRAHAGKFWWNRLIAWAKQLL
jgi:hypothetical protein